MAPCRETRRSRPGHLRSCRRASPPGDGQASRELRNRQSGTPHRPPPTRIGPLKELANRSRKRRIHRRSESRKVRAPTTVAPVPVQAFLQARMVAPLGANSSLLRRRRLPTQREGPKRRGRCSANRRLPQAQARETLPRIAQYFRDRRRPEPRLVYPAGTSATQNRRPRQTSSQQYREKSPRRAGFDRCRLSEPERLAPPRSSLAE